MTGSKKYSNSKFLLNNKRAKAIFIQGFSTEEAKSILSRLMDVVTLMFEMYYIKFKIQEIKDSIHAFTENKKGKVYSFARNLSAPSSFETNYATTTQSDLAS